MSYNLNFIRTLTTHIMKIKQFWNVKQNLEPKTVDFLVFSHLRTELRNGQTNQLYTNWTIVTAENIFPSDGIDIIIYWKSNTLRLHLKKSEGNLPKLKHSKQIKSHDDWTCTKCKTSLSLSWPTERNDVKWVEVYFS